MVLHPTPNVRSYCMFQAAAKAMILFFPASLVLGQSYISNLYIMFSLISCSLWTLTQRQFSLPLEGVNLPSFLAKGKTVKADTLAFFSYNTRKTKHLENCLTVMTTMSLETLVLFLALPHIASVSFCRFLKTWLWLNQLFKAWVDLHII